MTDIMYVYRESYTDAYDYERAVGMMTKLYMFRLPVVNGWKFFNTYMPLSYEQVKTAVDNTKALNFVPPVDAFDLGKYAFRYGLMIRSWWARQVANGWEFEAGRCFDGLSNEDVNAAMSFAASLE